MEGLALITSSISSSSEGMPICVICGENHLCTECTLIEIKAQVVNRIVPTRARATLPACLNIETMSDQNSCIVAKTLIERGTKFGPLEAEKSFTLDTNAEFSLKIFHSEDKESDYYLNACDENNCNWLMFIQSAQRVEEQNLICYQENFQIFYVTVKDIHEGEYLKAWYAPYYALRMNKNLLMQPVFEHNNEKSDKIEEPMVLDNLIKTQQKILVRENWTCKFCGQVEIYVSQFAKHIRQHYADKQYSKTNCDLCNKSFETPQLYRRHFKIMHEKVALARKKTKTKKTQAKDPNLNNKDVLIGGQLINNMLNDSMDNSNLLLPNVDLAQLGSALPNNLGNESILLDMSLNVDNLLSDNVKELDHFNFEVKDSQEQYVCDICLRSFPGLLRFLQHLNKHTGRFTCQNCLKVFCRKENLNAHNCNMPNFSCEICQKPFKLRKHLKRHFDSAHNKKYTCPNCNKFYYSSTELSEHNCVAIPNEGKQKFSCTICDKTFLLKKYLQRHLKTHNNNNNNNKNQPPKIGRGGLICEICAKIFTSIHGFNHHRKTHAERTYTCKVCSQKFHRVDVLRVHMSQHKEDKAKEQQCNSCNLTFKTARMLLVHRREQHTLTPKTYNCDKCNKSFVQRYLLAKHKSTSHSKICRHCNEHFESEALLATHEFVHAKDCFQCPVCHNKMKLRSSLNRHFKKLHPGLTISSALEMKSAAPKTNIAVQTDENDPDAATNLLAFEDNNNENEINAEFDDYSSCQSILDNFEDILNGCNSNDTMNLLESTDNLNKETVNEQHFEFEDFGIEVQNGLSQNMQDTRLCLSMPDIMDTEQEVILGDRAYMLEDGTIVEPNDTGEVVVYLTK